MTDKDLISKLRSNAKVIPRSARDKAADTIEALTAERDKLNEALGEIQGMGFDMPMTLELTDEQWARRRASLMQQIAAAALGETEK